MHLGIKLIDQNVHIFTGNGGALSDDFTASSDFIDSGWNMIAFTSGSTSEIYGWP